MAKIIGNVTTTPMAVSDWNQTDETKADYIKNKPIVLTEDEIINLIEEKSEDVNVQSDWVQTDETKVDYIKNKPTLGDLATKSTVAKTDLATDVQASLDKADSAIQSVDDKVDKVVGKGLSTNDYTTEEKTKLTGIEDGAQVNVQSDWNQTDIAKADYIKNKPTNVSSFENDVGYLTKHQSLDGLATETYVDTKIAAIPTPDVSGQIDTHNTSTTAHNDIRTDIEKIEDAIGGLRFSVKENGILTISTEEE